MYYEIFINFKNVSVSSLDQKWIMQAVNINLRLLLNDSEYQDKDYIYSFSLHKK